MATGHVRKRGTTWSFVHFVQDPATGTGKYKWKGGYATKREAERAMREAMTSADVGAWIEPSKLTLEDYVLDIWLPLMKDQIESSTWESYRRNMIVHVLPNIGKVRLQKLGPVQLNEVYRIVRNAPATEPTQTNHRHDQRVYERIFQLRETGKSYQAVADAIREEFPTEQALTRHAVARIVARSKEAKPVGRTELSITTVRYIHTIVSRAMREAIRLGFIQSNPAANASPPRKSKAKPPRVMWTGDETRRFLEWAREIDHRFYPAWVFIATSADRRGGNLGLRWIDIDLEEGRARHIWSVTVVASQIVVKPYGKAGDPHEILLDAGTIAVLKTWRARQAQEKLLFGEVHRCASPQPGCKEPGYHQRDLVFCKPDGDYLHGDRFTREFQRTQRRYNQAHPDQQLPIVNIHALRHGWATLALEAGIPMKVVQDRLNHASERITADIYTHVRSAVQSDAALKVAGRILG